MIFLGYAFAAAEHSLDPMPFETNAIEYGDRVTLSAAEYDELYVTADTNSEYNSEISETWDYDTLLHAYFNGDMTGGNINFYLSEIDSLRLKRRMDGKTEWVTMCEFPVNSADDLQFEYFDHTARSKKKYQYKLVPMVGGVEYQVSTNTVDSEFDGCFIVGTDQVYSTILDVNISDERNRPVKVVSTINRKYPIVVQNSINNFDSGSFSGTFIEHDTTADTWDIEGAWEFRRQFEDFMMDGSPKILKHEDGRMWLIEMAGETISNDNSGHPLKFTTSFNWAEIGDVDSADDLYTYGFLGGE